MRMIFRSAQKNIFFSSCLGRKVRFPVEKPTERGTKNDVYGPFFL